MSPCDTLHIEGHSLTFGKLFWSKNMVVQENEYVWFKMCSMVL